MRFVTSLLISEERDRAEPRALDAAEPADDRDHEQLDRRVETHRRRRELPEPPRVEDASERRDERADAEGERPVERDVVAERGHTHRLVADALE